MSLYIRAECMKEYYMSNNLDWTCWRNPRHPVKPHPVFGWPQCQHCQAAPQYHERSQWLPADLQLAIYVPSPFARFGVAPGAGIVGVNPPLGNDIVFVHYEGWVHGAMQYADRDARGRWEAGVYHAASRLVTAYPTIAQANVPRQQLRRIGTYNPTTDVVTVTDEAALSVWLGRDDT